MLEKSFVMAWNGILENREYFLRKWAEQEKSKDLLVVYRAKDFQELMNVAVVETKTNFILIVLDCIKVFEDGQLLVVLLDGTEIECRRDVRAPYGSQI